MENYTLFFLIWYLIIWLICWGSMHHKMGGKAVTYHFVYRSSPAKVYVDVIRCIFAFATCILVCNSDGKKQFYTALAVYGVPALCIIDTVIRGQHSAILSLWSYIKSVIILFFAWVRHIGQSYERISLRDKSLPEEYSYHKMPPETLRNIKEIILETGISAAKIHTLSCLAVALLRSLFYNPQKVENAAGTVLAASKGIQNSDSFSDFIFRFVPDFPAFAMNFYGFIIVLFLFSIGHIILVIKGGADIPHGMREKFISSETDN